MLLREKVLREMLFTANTGRPRTRQIKVMQALSIPHTIEAVRVRRRVYQRND